MKKYSVKKSIMTAAHILQSYGIKNVIISPGSRNAPIAVHFAETEYFSCYSIVDERSAAFAAIGMAMHDKPPTVLCCTSGSAAANYYPAITEAFYSNIPLLIITADRPSDFTDIFDGQTIRQKDLYSQHSYGDFQLLEDGKEGSEEMNFDTIKKAVELCFEKQGPVHINFPLEEPLYDFVSELPLLPAVENTVRTKKYEIPATLAAEWNTAKRIMILVGTRLPDEELEGLMSQLVKNHSAIVLTEVGSNLKNPKFFGHIDRYVYNFSDEDFRTYSPDLLITVGQNVVSKKIKQFLRKAAPAAHWHIDEHWHPDTYFSLTSKVECSATTFFRHLLPQIKLEPAPYYNLWNVLRDKRDAQHDRFARGVEFSDFKVFELLSEKIPENASLHIGNSSAVRYAQLFNFKNKIYCNRGTSGIDGCTSTAMGFAVKNSGQTVLVTGDLSFFYDINGLWNQYIPPFTRIIVINNGGGDIFKIIPGPDRANPDVLDEFIATTHHKDASMLAKQFGFGYTATDEEGTLERILDQFFQPSEVPKILEIKTQALNNSEVLKNYFRSLDDF